MVSWSGQALILSCRPFGEQDGIVHFLTADQGWGAGLFRNAMRSHKKSSVEPGSLVNLHWRARLSEHLGQIDLDLDRSYAAQFLQDPWRLEALSSVCALLDQRVMEGDPHPDLYHQTLAFLAAMADQTFSDRVGLSQNMAFLPAYCLWEKTLLAELGFGFDFTVCAVTGQSSRPEPSEDHSEAQPLLTFVSPRTGGAVTDAGAGPWRDRLLPLPRFLYRQEESCPSGEDLLAALRLTGHFLQKYAQSHDQAPLPAARERLRQRLLHFIGQSSSP